MSPSPSRRCSLPHPRSLPSFKHYLGVTSPVAITFVLQGVFIVLLAVSRRSSRNR
ncbi:hypothetical protein FIBSPDRAFT_874935 [Athelia psychrophila]|uniref:Uncharacterized protein n=1 Tax=Athelia psychrophila TaxID=1759441 RepID=A0A165WXB7_9AGAM|nr:hypothetical protein FIBSPDRAFT_874935 [Fibularhizoctonia sp. CBS 109695]